MKSSELAPLLFTVYLAAASGHSPALPCFAAFLALVRFSGLFAFTQLFFQTHKITTLICAYHISEKRMFNVTKEKLPPISLNKVTSNLTR
jgi:hypothetical protein